MWINLVLRHKIFFEKEDKKPDLTPLDTTESVQFRSYLGYRGKLLVRLTSIPRSQDWYRSPLKSTHDIRIQDLI
jgi:hypothetical protein